MRERGAASAARSTAIWAATLLCAAACALGAEAQAPDTAPLLWSTGDDDLSAVSAAARRGAAAALPGARHVALDCDHQDAVCVAAAMRRSGARRLVALRTHWVRRGCSPIIRDGARVGSRMMRARVVELFRYDATGQVTEHRTVDLDPSATAAQVTARVRELLTSAP